MSSRSRSVKPDILVSIHGLAPDFFPNFRKPVNIPDGLHKRVVLTRFSAITSRTLYFQATG